MSSSTLYSPVIASHIVPSIPPSRNSPPRWGLKSSSSVSISQKPLPPDPTNGIKIDRAEGRSFFQVWWKELGTCFLILAALFAIVATVLPFQGKTLPNWPYSLSINTLVSIYVAILKFTMAFVLAECIGQIKWTWFEHPRPLTDLVPYDDASRGSLWGSLKLLWTLRGRSILASVGALVTVLSAIIDPFAQQLVQYTSCPQQAASSNASVPITHMWKTSGEVAGAGQVNLGYEMQGAVINGLLNRQSFDSPFSCSTGNCTFPETYYTLGYYSVCEDVTKEITTDEDPITVTMTAQMAKTVIGLTTTATSTQTVTDEDEVETLTQTATIRQTGTTQVGFAVETASIESGGNYRLKSGTNAGGPQGNFQIAINATGDSTKPNVPMIVLEALYADPSGQKSTTGQNNSETGWQKRGFGAARCGIQVSVQGYNATVEAGKIHETLVETSYDTPWHIDPTVESLVLVRTSCLKDSKQRDALQQQAQLDWDKMPAWYPYNPTWRNKNATGWPFNDPNMPLECMYIMDISSVKAVGQFFKTFLTGSLHTGSRTSTGGDSYQQSAFWRSGNASFATINGTVHNITRSMTNAMRQSEWANLTTGQLTTQGTCVGVDWRWLAFPATLTGLTLLCFIATSIVTHRKAGDDLRAHDFKTAVLPLMFAASKLHQPPHDAQCSGVQDKIKDSVKKRHVRFERSEDGWHFTELPAGGVI